MEETFSVRILGPHEVVWEGQVTALEATNVEGLFSILPDHAQFMTILSPEPIQLFLPSGETLSYTFPNAVLVFADNAAKVFTQPPPTTSKV